MAKKISQDLIKESNELDLALRSGRVGDLIRKYNPREQQKESVEDIDELDEEKDVEPE